MSYSTADLVAWDRQYVWHPFTPMKPWCENKEIVVIERGEGEYLIDTEGRRYIDGVSSLWCNVHGHNVPELNQAVVEQLGKVAHSTLLGLANVPSAVLAKRLVELAQGAGLGLDKVFYSDNGSTAVEVACKMAYQYWRNRGAPRGKFLAFRNAYHGDTVGAVSVGGIPLFHEAFRGLTFAVDFMPAPSAASLDALAARLAEGRGGDAYAAIIVEPLVMGAGGMVMYGAEHLRRLRALADAHDTLLIADEVLTGFGRTGTMFACEGAGVTPDLMCLSKGLTAGYMPLGVTMTTQRVFDAFYVDPNANGGEHAGKTFFHGHTFTGHPLACAVAVKSLELFEKNGVMAHVERLRPILAEALGRARGGRGGAYVRGARQCGLIGAIDLGWPDGGSFPYHWRVGGEVCARLRGRGIFLRPLADTLVIMPPLAVGEETLRRLCAGVLEGITWVEEIVGRKAAGG